MNRLSATAVAAALVLAGCRDAANTTATSAEFSPAANALTCNFRVIKPAARTYFSGALSPIEALINQMQSQYLAGNVPATRTAGLDVLVQVAAAHAGQTAAGTPADGSVLTNDILACMSYGVGQTDFSGALGPYGGFAVRGGASDGDGTPIVALGLNSGVAPPAAGFASWLRNTRGLFYGAPVPNTAVTEIPVGQQGYVWSTVPAHHADLNGFGVIGICNGASGRDRLQEDGVFLTLAPITALGLDCTTQLGSLGQPTTMFGRLAHAGLRLLLPTPAYAAQNGGTGGLAGGFSQFGVTDAGAVNLVMRPVKPSRVGTVMPNVEVIASGNMGSRLPGVVITLDIETGPDGANLTGHLAETTNAFGVANFRTLSLDQAGTYTFGATSSFSGFTPATAVSGNFQVAR